MKYTIWCYWGEKLLTLISDLCFSVAFSISSENSQVVLIAISSAVVIILLSVVLYIVIGR